MASGRQKKKPDRKQEQSVRGQDEMIHGQTTIQEMLKKKLFESNSEKELAEDERPKQSSEMSNLGKPRVISKDSYNFSIIANKLYMMVGNNGHFENAGTDQRDAAQETKNPKEVEERPSAGEGIQETSKNSRPSTTKLSEGDPIKKLWDIRQGFRDDFCKALNVTYRQGNNIKNWRYLAEKFEWDRHTIDTFSSYDLVSPSDTMFQKLEQKDPDLTIEDLCRTLKKAKAHDVLRVVEEAIKDKKLEPDILISDVWDEAPDEFERVMLTLDSMGIWKDVARCFGFKRKDCEIFERNMDPALNYTRDLFDILRTQHPGLTVRDFKKELGKIEQKKVLKIFTKDVSDNMSLSELSQKGSIMGEIEHILNNPRDQSLWELAEIFKKDYPDLDIDTESFRYRGIDASPTYHLMEHVIARSPKELTIQELVIKLLEINRTDCVNIIKKYMEASNEEIKQACQKTKNPQFVPSNERREQENDEVTQEKLGGEIEEKSEQVRKDEGEPEEEEEQEKGENTQGKDEDEPEEEEEQEKGENTQGKDEDEPEEEDYELTP